MAGDWRTTSAALLLVERKRTTVASVRVSPFRRRVDYRRAGVQGYFEGLSRSGFAGLPFKGLGVFEVFLSGGLLLRAGVVDARQQVP